MAACTASRSGPCAIFISTSANCGDARSTGRSNQLKSYLARRGSHGRGDGAIRAGASTMLRLSRAAACSSPCVVAAISASAGTEEPSPTLPKTMRAVVRTSGTALFNAWVARDRANCGVGPLSERGQYPNLADRRQARVLLREDRGDAALGIRFSRRMTAACTSALSELISFASTGTAALPSTFARPWNAAMRIMAGSPCALNC